jgi:hypothetical protein
MSVFEEVHDREVAERRHSMIYAAILVVAIIAVIASIFLAYI